MYGTISAATSSRQSTVNLPSLPCFALLCPALPCFALLCFALLCSALLYPPFNNLVSAWYSSPFYLPILSSPSLSQLELVDWISTCWLHVFRLHNLHFFELVTVLPRTDNWAPGSSEWETKLLPSCSSSSTTSSCRRQRRLLVYSAVQQLHIFTLKTSIEEVRCVFEKARVEWIYWRQWEGFAAEVPAKW